MYRIVHFRFEKGQPIPFKAYPPRPEQCLAFYPYDTEEVEYAASGRRIQHLPAVLYGQFTEVTNRVIGQHFLVLQVVFLPGALYRLTGIPATELTNQYLDARLVFSNTIRAINEQLYHAKSYDAMLSIVTNFIRQLARQAKTQLPVDTAFSLLLEEDNTISIDELARQACLSVKQLERKCKERTGVNPKTYTRIIRFDNAFRLKNSSPRLDWLRIAVECGYHDYQHLVKAYKDFTGLSPTAFHEIESKAPERRFGLVEGYYK